jgi:hypothetical protein
MNKFITLFIIAILLVGFSINLKAEGEPFAVLELYTSEGCSSCPSADKLLTQLLDYPGLKDQNFLALAYHVTYWDYLGWKDILAKTQFDNRQTKQCSYLGIKGRYTPMLIVDGKKASLDGNEIVSLLTTSIKEKATTSIKLTQVESFPTIDGGKCTVAYDLENIPVGSILTIVMHQSKIISTVTAGENKGKTLHHDNVVLSMTEVVVEGTHGYANLEIPAGMSTEMLDCKFAAFARASGSYEIFAATAGEDVMLEVSVDDKNDSETHEMLVYPNPASDDISLILPELQEQTGSVVLRNVYGTEVFRMNDFPKANSLNISDLAVGTYFLQYRIGGKDFVAKFIKQ